VLFISLKMRNVNIARISLCGLQRSQPEWLGRPCRGMGAMFLRRFWPWRPPSLRP